MFGLHILGQNQTATNADLKISISSNGTINDADGGNQVCKAKFWFLVCLCVLLFVLIILIWVRNKWRKGKQQLQNFLIGIYPSNYF